MIFAVLRYFLCHKNELLYQWTPHRGIGEISKRDSSCRITRSVCWSAEDECNNDIATFTAAQLAELSCCIWDKYVCDKSCEYPWCSGSVLDYWSTGRAIDPVPGAWFMTKFISLYSSGCPRTSIALQCRIVARNTIHLISCGRFYLSCSANLTYRAIYTTGSYLKELIISQ